MKPLNKDEPGCNYTSSNCVIWQGPDLDCIKLCKGDSISDVVAKLATELCSVMELLDVVNYDLTCLNIKPVAPTNFHDFLQLLIDTICALQTATGVITPVLVTTDPQMPVARIFQYVDAYGNTVTTMPLPNYVTAIGNEVNKQYNQLVVLETVTAVHTEQIATVQDSLNSLPDNSQPLVVPDACILPAIPTPVPDVVSAMSLILCSLQAATGNPTEIYTAVSKQCAGLALQQTLSNNLVTYNGIPGWNNVMNNGAAALNNIQLVLCDVISAIRTVQLCCNNGCSSIALALYATVTGTDINVFLTGVVPPQFIDCAGPGSLVTITDSSGNFFTTNMSITGFVNNPYVISTLLTPVDPTKNITVTIMPCLIDNANATTCQSVISYLIVSQVNCPVMTYIPSMDAISFSGVPTTGTNTYDVQLYDSTASTLLSSVSQIITFPVVFVGNFPGLGPNLSYTLRVVITNPSGAVTSCPFFGVALLPTAFLPVPLGAASTFVVLGATGINNIGGTFSTFIGDVGSDPTVTIVGITAPDVTGTLYLISDPAVIAAQVALTNAITDATTRTPMTSIPAALAGTIITPGYYNITGGAGTINGNVTFDAAGDPNAVFIIESTTSLTTSPGAIVTLINGATFDNIFWSVGLLDVGAGSIFKGVALATGNITVDSSDVQGVLLSKGRVDLLTGLGACNVYNI